MSEPTVHSGTVSAHGFVCNLPHGCGLDGLAAGPITHSNAGAAHPPLDGLDREKLAYSLRTHLCYGAITPEDKGIDVLIERYRSYTPEKLAQMDGVLTALRDEGETT